jgi:hypothetical protein
VTTAKAMTKEVGYNRNFVHAVNPRNEELNLFSSKYEQKLHEINA